MNRTLQSSIASLLLTASLSVSAAETVCNDNGGAGWPYAVSSTTNIPINFNFGDVSEVFDLDVYFETSKVYVGDLTGYVTSPAATEVQLFERPGTALNENTLGPPYGCANSDMAVTFDDEAATNTNVEAICAGGAPTISGTYRAQGGAGTEMQAFDGENPNGVWNFRLVHAEPFDPGNLDEACITAAFAAVTFDKWVSSNNACTDTIDSIAIAPGTEVYFCYYVENPSTETFEILLDDWADSEGHDLSDLERIYNQNDDHTYVDGPIVAGSLALPVGTTTNNASVTGTFATANFAGTLTTPESATVVVADPDLSSSTKTWTDVNGGALGAGDIIEYTITINETAGIYTPAIQVTDVLDANFGSLTFITLPAGSTNNTVGNNIDISDIVVPANGSETIVFRATISNTIAPGTDLDNTATISHAASGVSEDAVAPTITIVPAVLTTSTKTWVDLNGGSQEPGDIIEYTITVTETAGVDAYGVQVVDTVDANLNTITVMSTPAGSTDGSAGNNIDVSNITVGASSSETVVFRGTIDGAATPGTNIDNTATITHTNSSTNFDAAAPTLIVSAPELGTSTKVELDIDGAPALTGDTIRYTITINETGGNPATNVSVTDFVDANLTNVNVTTVPGGATDNSSGNTVQIDGINIAASGSATIIFEADIVGIASPGTTIDNTASIVDVPTGESASPSAGTVIVSSPPTSGSKQLYFETLNGTPDLTRVVTTGDTQTGNVDVVTLNQGAVFQEPFTITGGTNVFVQVRMRRRNGGGNRDVDVDLINGGDGTVIGSTTLSWNAGGWQTLTGNIAVATDYTFDPGDFVRVVLSNTPATNGNIQVRTLQGGVISQIQMQSNTVINIDSIGIFDAAYPATTAYKSYEPGSTVYVRATVSDPFGNADINNALITITDPTPTTLVNSVDMGAPVANPDGATSVFEYQYTIPANPDGFWDVSVTANEGTEGTVAHTSNTTLIVGTPSISVVKLQSVVSDPVNSSNYKAIPNAIVEYSVLVSNTGYGYADDDSVIIFDPLDTNEMTLVLGNPANPATFIQGGTTSGLSYNFTSLSSTTDDVAFSNNGGVSFVTPSVDINGYDTTVPPINYIQFNPKGDFRGTDGISNPSFTIRFRVRID